MNWHRNALDSSRGFVTAAAASGKMLPVACRLVKVVMSGGMDGAVVSRQPPSCPCALQLASPKFVPARAEVAEQAAIAQRGTGSPWLRLEPGRCSLIPAPASQLLLIFSKGWRPRVGFTVIRFAHGKCGAQMTSA